MPVDTWLKENWGWLGGGAAAIWGAYQWLRIEARNGATAAATREHEASERLWARLNTYVDDMEGVVKALRAENATLHEEIGAYRKRTVELEDLVAVLKRQVHDLGEAVRSVRAGRGLPMSGFDDQIGEYLRNIRR